MKLIKLFGDERVPKTNLYGEWHLVCGEDCISCEDCGTRIDSGDEYYLFDNSIYCCEECASSFV